MKRARFGLPIVLLMAFGVWVLLGAMREYSLRRLELARKVALPSSYATLHPLDVKDIPGDVPPFKREYTETIIRGIVVKITMRSSSWGRSVTGEMTQPNGSWVLFDPESPADKIIDPVILPIVTRICKQADEQDKAYIASRPSEYVDEAGSHWKRIP